MRPIGQVEQSCDAEQDSWDSFEEKQPAPASDTQPVNSENHSGDRRTNDEANRYRRHEARDCLAAILIDEPVRKINNHAGKEPRLRSTEQKTRAVKLQRTAHEPGQSGESAPRDQRQREQA